MFSRTVYLVDVDPSSRRDIVAQLAALETEAWPFPTPSHFVDALGGLRPACVILSGDMTRSDSFTVLETLAERNLEWPVVVIASRGDVCAAIDAMKLGAVEYLERPVAARSLEEALAVAWEALEDWAVAEDARRLAGERVERLTPRELDVTRALIAGMGNKAVAYHLGLSVRTVEMHRAKALKKLQVRNLAEGAVLIAHTDFAVAHRTRTRRRKVHRQEDSSRGTSTPRG